ncbi:MAG: hypothetical protein C4563_08505 [Desulfobulbus sp.]|nr:MAG: hypothetical protein C4563_08505 [Desulfobulbus sp.]
MKCAFDEMMLSQYLEKDLDAETMERITGHIRECPLCRKEVERLKTAVRIIRSLEEVAPPRNYLESVGGNLKKSSAPNSED